MGKDQEGESTYEVHKANTVFSEGQFHANQAEAQSRFTSLEQLPRELDCGRCQSRKQAAGQTGRSSQVISPPASTFQEQTKFH